MLLDSHALASSLNMLNKCEAPAEENDFDFGAKCTGKSLPSSSSSSGNFHIDGRFPFVISKSIFKKPNGTGSNIGMTPLMVACAYGRSSVVVELLKRQADVMLADDEGSTLLHHAIRYEDIFKMIITTREYL